MPAKSSLITARITPEQYDFLSLKQFKNKQQGLSACLEVAMSLHYSFDKTDPQDIVEQIYTLQKIRAYSAMEIKAIFTEREIAYMIDALTGTKVLHTHRCSKEVLLAYFAEANTFRACSINHEMNSIGFEIKIKNLSAAQVDAIYCLYETQK